jgi:hypothetical protein
MPPSLFGSIESAVETRLYWMAVVARYAALCDLTDRQTARDRMAANGVSLGTLDRYVTQYRKLADNRPELDSYVP